MRGAAPVGEGSLRSLAPAGSTNYKERKEQPRRKQRKAQQMHRFFARHDKAI